MKNRLLPPLPFPTTASKLYAPKCPKEEDKHRNTSPWFYSPNLDKKSGWIHFMQSGISKHFQNFWRLQRPITTQLSIPQKDVIPRELSKNLDYFGLIHLEKEEIRYNTKNYITKTEIFDKLIKITPPKTLS